MLHAFAPAISKQKVLKRKLDYANYMAVFSNSANERHANLNNAYALKPEIEALLTQVAQEAGQVTSLMNQPGLGLLETTDRLINLVESSSSKMGAGSQMAQ